MKKLKFLFILQTIAIIAYTLMVGINHGWDLVSVFFDDLFLINWSGQFNFDFMNYLILSAIWICWRHKFSSIGIILGLLASVLGILFFAPYLLHQTIKVDGNIKFLLLGEHAIKA